LRIDVQIASVRRTVVAFALLCGSVSAWCAQPDADQCGTPGQRKVKEVALRSTVTEVLQAIRSKNAPAFLMHTDDRGVWFWGGLLSVNEIKREFREKEGLYCLLFSSPCLASTKFPSDVDADLSTWKMSYREWLERNSPTTVEIDMGYGGEEEPCSANVSVRAGQKSRSMPETFELGFDYRGDRWLFRCTPAYPKGIARGITDYFGDQERPEARHRDKY
jgi:hypothetical protein